MRKFIANSRQRIVTKVKHTSSRIKRYIQGRIDKTKQIAKDHYYTSRQEPKSKFKSVLVGFSAGLAIFGITVLIPFLPAIAKDIPVPTPPPSKPELVPAKAPVFDSEMVKGLASFASIICAGAVQNGLVGLGIVCGIIVGAGMWFKKKSSG